MRTHPNDDASESRVTEGGALRRRDPNAKRAEVEFTRSILNSSHDCIVILDLAGNNLFVSPGAIAAMEVDDVEAIIGLSWLRVWKGADLKEAKRAVATAASGAIGRFSGFCPTHKGKPKWWDVMISPLPDRYGRPERLMSVGRDITERKIIQDQLELSQHRLNLALNASGMIGTWTWDIKQDRIYGDENAARLYGIEADLILAGASPAQFTRNFHPADAGPEVMLRNVIEEGDELARERRIVLPDGAIRWLLVRGKLVRDQNGEPSKWPGASVDITELKRAQEQQRLLLDELGHRVKNTLAIVQAISSQTLKHADTLSAAQTALSARLVALSQAHDLLLRGNWSKADMRSLVEGALQLHDVTGKRFEVEGAPLSLAPQPALSFALLLHELGTNAVKYGALSGLEGRVAVNWRNEMMNGEMHVRFTWREERGPTITAPSRKGFGSKLIERTLAEGLGAVVELTFPESGASVTLDVPLSKLQ